MTGKKIAATISAIVMVLSLGMSMITNAANNPWKPGEDQPYAYRQKDIFETETVRISGISVSEVVNDTISPMVTTPIIEEVSFRIYNSTRQETEMMVQSVNGKLPDLDLKKNHNYIIISEDQNYRMPNVYIWVKDNKIVDIKQYYPDANNFPVVDGLRLYKRSSPATNPEDDQRVMVNLTLETASGGPLYNTKVKFVSAWETIEVNSGNKGRIQERLIEDANYMVIVEHDTYGISSFPIAVKDKSEFYAGKYSYDHSSCAQVEKLIVTKKADVHKDDTVITNTNYDEVFGDVYSNISGTTTVKGMNFKDFLVLENLIQKDYAELANKNYETYEIKIVNPHRWEVAKLAAGEFEITKTVEQGKRVIHIYEDRKGSLEPLKFEQNGNDITFKTDSMSLYPIVIEYEKDNNPFTDVKVGAYYYKAVLWAVKNNITSGVTETSFAPDDGCTRAQAVTFLWRAAGEPEPESASTAFTDVIKGQYYEKAVLWAVENGITSGTSATTFSPDENCSRAQIVSFLWRMDGKPDPADSVMKFTDVSAGAYYKDAVLWAVENEITHGTSATTFSPDENCTRAQIVSFLYRHMAE